jgi:hypothetical protein
VTSQIPQASVDDSDRDSAARAAKQLLRASCGFRERVRTHVFDLLVLFLAIPGPVLLFRFVARQSFPHGKSMQVIVALPTGIPAYHVILPQDVSLASVTTTSGSLGKPDELVGHFSKRPLRVAEIILSSWLSTDKIDSVVLSGRRTMLIPVRTGSLASNARLPLHVSLQVSSTKEPSQTPLSVRDAYILDFKSIGDPSLAVVAVQPGGVQLLTRRLGTSEVYISQAIP